MLLPPQISSFLYKKNSRNKPEMRKNEKKQSFSIIKIITIDPKLIILFQTGDLFQLEFSFN